MKYFKIFESFGEDVGHSPQVHSGVIDFDIYGPKSASHLNFARAQEDTLWPVGKLSGKAKKTDLISTSYYSFSGRLLISQKLYNLLSGFKNEGIQYIQTRLITRKGKEEPYWIVNPYLSNYSFLDISNCEFVYTDHMGKLELSAVSFRTANEFIEACLQNRIDVVKGDTNAKLLIIKKIAFLPGNDIHFCAVANVNTGIGFFISETLKEETLRQGITGIILKDPNSKYPF